MSNKDMELCLGLINAARRAITDGLIWGTAGNFSARSSNPNHILITPSGTDYVTMEPEQIIKVDLEGKIIEGDLMPSSETPVHCAVYRTRKGVSAVIHTEPPHVNGFGVARKEIPIVTHNLGKVGGAVPIGPCMTSGSSDFASGVLEAMGNRNAVIWPNHGLMTVGTSIGEALKLSWRIENAAKVYIFALQLGEPHLFCTETEKEN